MDSGEKSYTFEIGDAIFNDVRDKSLKSFYYERASIDIEAKYAGDEYSRSAGHLYKLKYHESSELYDPKNPKKAKDLSGGWYDAGDYGRYTVSAAISLGVMLIGYENYPQKFENDSLNIPESGNGIPDFLDEMKYELDWMQKMQNLMDGKFKGALPYMLNSKKNAYGMPENLTEIDKQYIYGFSSVVTADFAAVMALASRVFKEYDSKFPGYSKKCLRAAELAWEYLEQNPDVYPDGGYVRPKDTETGGYGQFTKYNDEDIDDRLWAAIELNRATGNSKYLTYFNNKREPLNESWNTIWHDTRGYAKIQYLLADGLDEDLKSLYKSSLLNTCDQWVSSIVSDGFKTLLKTWDYRWGANGEVLLNKAAILILAYEETGDVRYYNAALSQLNYILGINIHNISFVTHTGTVSPKRIYNHMYQAEGYVFPGLLPGGANGYLGDTGLDSIYNESTPPAKCYVDRTDSWTSNENCILFNAPLVPVTAYFSK